MALYGLAVALALVGAANAQLLPNAQCDNKQCAAETATW
jgi:hypothetical protein